MSEEIFKNETEIKKRIKDAEQALPAANKTSQLFTNEGLTPTIDHLKGFLAGGAEYLIGVLGAIAREDIAKMDIKLDRMKQSFLRDATAIDEAKVSKIHAELYRAMGTAKIKPDNLEITKSWEVRLRKDFLADVEAQFTVDLNHPETKEMYVQFQVFCHAFNKLQEMAEARGELSLHECLDPRYGAFFTERPGDYPTIEPDPSYFLAFNGNNGNVTEHDNGTLMSDDPTVAKLEML